MSEVRKALAAAEADRHLFAPDLGRWSSITEQALYDLMMGALPEPKRATGDLDPDYRHGVHDGYNTALLEVEIALSRLFGRME